MQKGFAKGLKPIFVKRLALLIGICYMLNPLQQQITIIFHEVSHALEIPDHILAHDSNQSYEQEEHGHAEHSVKEANHNHKFIDLIASVFEASNENNDSEDSILTKIKIDKHLTAFQFQFQRYFSKLIAPEFWWLTEKLKLAHLIRLKEPPQFSYFQSV